MCGLMGIAVSGSYTKMSGPRLNLFVETAALVSATRGKDGTGLALVKDPNEQAEVYKESIQAWNFLETGTWEKANKSIGGTKAALIHTRKATIGDATYGNTHPFVSGPITLEHNGTLRTYPKSGSTDSEWLCDLIANSKDVLGTLEGVDGAYALVWHDASTGEINITRNNERPLVIMSCEGGDVLMWASEEWMLAACASRIGLILHDAEIDDLPPGELLTIKLGAKLGTTKRMYTPMPKVTTYTNYYGYDNKSTNTPPAQGAATSLACVPSTQQKKLPNGWGNGKILHFCVEEESTLSGGAVRISGTILEDSEEYIEATATIPAKEWRKYKNVVEPVFSGKIAYTMEKKFSNKGRGYLSVTLVDCAFVGTYRDVESKFLMEHKGATMYEGPWGERLDAADMTEFLEEGCSCCKQPLYLEDVEEGKVSWDTEGSPLCSKCAVPVTVN